MPINLSPSEKIHLLKIARQALEYAAQGKPMRELHISELPVTLRGLGATFVTLRIDERLRGCIGTIDAYQPLARNVQENAVAAGMHDFRFPKVTLAELSLIKIEISVLTPHTQLLYDQPKNLPYKIRPLIDGVILQDGGKKATFLPQVWEKLPKPEEFLTQLCCKMGAPGDLWQKKLLDVFVYQVQNFQE